MPPQFNSLGLFLILATFFIFLMGVFIILIIFLHNRRQTRNQQTLQELRNDFEKELLKAQIEIQENTFEEISREIHDNINLALTVAKLNLNMLNGKGANVIEPIEIIGKAINDLTNLSRSMNSDIIKECGLLTALRLEFERINKLNKLNISFDVGGESVFLEGNKELYIFRIVQEALSNILKHSNAKNVLITIHYLSENIQVEIKDDGCGFLKKQVFQKRGEYPSLGFKNMEKRVKLMEGHLKVFTRPGEGTHLTFTLPIKQIA